MAKEFTRRKAIGLAVGAAMTAIPGSKWIFVLNEQGAIVKAAAQDDTDWTPVVLNRHHADALAAVCEAIIPRTDTAGARDARVHEYIDLSLTIESQDRRTNFIESLEWFDGYCTRVCGRDLASASDEQLIEVLTTVSDATPNHPDAAEKGVKFFNDVKKRTIFAFYTSQEGRVDLGFPPRLSMRARFRGCPHSGEH